ncbi:MAG: tetratricopeptide repeat protein [Firmicutes bacterium]|nr:tetratricopeptide repeat protein [Bacillota bacterium]
MKKHYYFMISIIFLTILSTVIAPSPDTTCKIAGILFASTYLLFYSSDIAVFRYKILALKAIKNNDLTAVKEYYRRIHRISPNSLNGKTALAIIHTMEGKWGLAERLYREVLRARPQDPRIHYNLAVTLMRQGQYEEALKSLILIIHIFPKWAVTYSAVAEIYMAREEYSKADQYFRCALLIDKNDPSARHHLPILEKILEQAA